MKGEVMFENSISDPMVATTASLLGSKWSVLLLRIAMQDAVTNISPHVVSVPRCRRRTMDAVAVFA